MFYTKYRPQTFSQISRPNEAADALANQIATKKTAHAYLFVGPRGIGKTSTARIFAKALNCENVKSNGDPCDECASCISIKNGSFTDLIEIDAASNRGIDDIRELQSKINLAPVLGKNKIYIIDEVHMLTAPAFNALLKTLEEPPVHVTFILCTTEVNKVPETIKSRCQVFRFKRATIPQLSTKLKFIAQSEGHELEESVLASIAQYSLGGFRDAETLLQQIIEGGINPSALLTSLNSSAVPGFINYLYQKDRQGALQTVNNIYEEGIDLHSWLSEVISYLRNVILLKSGFSKEYFEVTPEYFENLYNMSKLLPINWIVNSLDILLSAHEKIKSSFIPQLPIEIAVVNICENMKNDESKLSNPSNPTSDLDGSGSAKGSYYGSISTPTKKYENNDTKPPVTKNMNIEKPKSTANTKEPVLTVVIEPVEYSPEIDAPLIEISVIESKWNDFLERTKEVNTGVLAMLKSSKPVNVKHKFIVLEVYFAFHKERIESSKNIKIIEDVLNEIYGLPLSVVCEISNQKPKKLSDKEVGYLTDANVVPVDSKELMNVFDGGLPL